MNSKDFLKKVSSISASTAKKAVRVSVAAGKKLADFQIPSSINWIYGFGFKVGIFLALKSALILKYQGNNLAITGFVTVIAQFVTAVMMIIGGVTMQSQRMYEDPRKLRRSANKYGVAAAFGLLIMLVKDRIDWSFFKNPAATNWFMNAWTAVTKGAGEITLSILFCDFDLWTLFCGLLYIIADVYLYEIFDDPQSLSGRLLRPFSRTTAALPVIKKITLMRSGRYHFLAAHERFHQYTSMAGRSFIPSCHAFVQFQFSGALQSNAGSGASKGTFPNLSLSGTPSAL